jgi:hypothetical protein
MLDTILAGLVFLLGISLPIFLLYRFHPLAWPWHALAVILAVAIGLAPGTALLNSVPGTFLYGFAIGFLGIWGLGGLAGFHRRAASRPHATIAGACASAPRSATS